MHAAAMNEVLEELLMVLDTDILCLQELRRVPASRRWMFKGYAVFIQGHAEESPVGARRSLHDEICYTRFSISAQDGGGKQ